MPTSFTFRASLILFSVALLAVAGSYVWNLRTTPAGTPQPRLRTVQVIFESGTVTAEVADTDEARQRGLSYRASLGPDEGMLFVFPFAAQQTMWMQAMNFPIDMIFIRGNRVVNYEEYVLPPHETRGRVSEVSFTEAADMVLELPAGKAEELKIGLGTTLRIK
jgi:uncharacterized membrane protein (UPF0127 family)